MNQLWKSLRTDLSTLLNVKEDSFLIKIYENSSNVFFTLEEFFNQYNPEELQKGQCNLMFRIDAGGKSIATFQLKDMYNCNGIIVGSDLLVIRAFRNKGLGTLLTKFMMEFSKYYGYGVIQAADLTSNEYQVKIFTKLGWEKSINFNNPKTGNNLTIWFNKF